MRIWIGDATGGQIAPVESARISPLDHGFTVADGVFETLKIVKGREFALTRHLHRLHRSAAVLGLQPPDHELVRGAVAELLSTGDAIEFGRLRITVTGGVAPLGSDRGDASPTVVIAATSAQPWPDTTTVRTVPWPRNERSALSGVKSTSYAENVHALAYAHERGASEAIFGNTVGDLCEGTGSNIFVVLDGVVCTPALVSGCLAGITRELVCEWFEVAEGSLPLDVLKDADEVFITSSTRDVHPVTRVDDRDLQAGPVTERIRAEFALRSAVDLDP